MHNIENKCKNFKNECTFIYFAKSSLQKSPIFSSLYFILLIEVILQIRKFIIMKRTYFQCDFFFLGAI